MDKAAANTLVFTEAARRLPGTFNRAASDTITFTETIVGIKLKVGHDSLTFTDLATAIVSRTIPETLIFVDGALGISNHQYLIEELFFFDDPRATSDRHRNAQTDNLDFSDVASGHRTRFRSASDTLTFTDILVREIHYSVATDFLELTDVASATTIHNAQATDSLVFTETNRLNRNAHVRATDTLVITETKFVPAENIYVPGPFGVLAVPTFVLRTSAGTVTLPMPEFQDSVNTTNTFNLRYSMTGTVHTTIKRRRYNRRLVYTFLLKRSKERELIQHLSVSNDKLMTLTNWKGEQWLVKLLTNPIASNNVTFDTFRVELEFEGIQLTSGGVDTTCQC